MIFNEPKIVEDQRKRLTLYTQLLVMASCPDETKALHKSYEVSRLLFINDEEVRQRNNMMLPKDTE